MINELSSITTEDPQVQVDQLRKAEAEEKARELFKHETSHDISYRKIIEKSGTGFMEAYIYITADFKTMTTRAKRNVVLALAKSDLFGVIFLLSILTRRYSS